MAERPNILIFMTDQQRADSLPPFSGGFKTPNLDRFAACAARFTRCSTPSPHCCPSRATFFSGLYPSRHGVWNNVNVGNALSRGLAKGVRLWSEDLRDAGYRMYFAGKWHVSAEEGPADRGFDILYHKDRYTGVRMADEERVANPYEWKTYSAVPPYDPSGRRPGEILREGFPAYRICGEADNPFGDGDVTDAAIRSIREMEPGAPWCIYAGVLGPHDPYFVPQKYLDLYDPAEIRLPDTFADRMEDRPALYRKSRAPFDQLTPEEHREAIRHYMAFVSYEDAQFGRVLAALRDSGQEENTVVMYLSDHGEYMGSHGLWTKGLPCFREAYHVPLLIRMPGQKRGLDVSARISLADLAPTILDIAGVAADRDFTGQSFSGYLLPEGPRPAPRYSYTQTNGNELYGIQRSITDGKWWFVYNGFDYDELYDLESDPGQTVNLAVRQEYADVIRRLSKELWRFARDNGDTCINPYIAVAHATFGPGILND